MTTNIQFTYSLLLLVTGIAIGIYLTRKYKAERHIDTDTCTEYLTKRGYSVHLRKSE